MEGESVVVGLVAVELAVEVAAGERSYVAASGFGVLGPSFAG